MNIDKEKMLSMSYYTDKAGDVIQEDPDSTDRPNTAKYYINRNPLALQTTHYEISTEEEVQACKHPRKWIKPTGGWIAGVYGRECKKCGGTQMKKGKFTFWPKKWESGGLSHIFTGTTTLGNGDVVVAMVNSGDYNLREALLAYSQACERCMNVLIRKYTPDSKNDNGYEEYSADWLMAGTRCNYCEDMPNTRQEQADWDSLPDYTKQWFIAEQEKYERKSKYRSPISCSCGHVCDPCKCEDSCTPCGGESSS